MLSQDEEASSSSDEEVAVAPRGRSPTCPHRFLLCVPTVFTSIGQRHPVQPDDIARCLPCWKPWLQNINLSTSNTNQGAMFAADP